MAKKEHCYDYPRPAVSADCVLFGFNGADLSILLVERGKEPFKGKWAFPGGFLDMDETTTECAQRELKEETGIDRADLEQLDVFSDVDRDPRGRVITVAYLGLLKMPEFKVVAGDDAADARWFKLTSVPPLAFDHDLILKTAVSRLKDKVRFCGGAFELLDERFSTGDLDRLYDTLFENKSPSGYYSLKMRELGMLEPVKRSAGQSDTGDRYYRFNRDKYTEHLEKFVFMTLS